VPTFTPADRTRAGFARMTIEKLLRDLGAACATYQDETLRNLPGSACSATRFSRSATRRRRTCPKNRGEFGYGDIWTWTAIDADTKLPSRYSRDGAGVTDHVWRIEEIVGLI